MAAELLVREAEVHEYLGVSRPQRVQVPSTNIGCLNALGQRWLQRDDVLRFLELSAANLDSDVLRTMHRQLSEVTEGP